MRLHPVGLLLSFDDVGVSLGGNPVLRGLTLRIDPGEVIGVSGPNGSGKTTILRTAATLIPPDQGSGEVLGARLGTGAVFEVRHQIGLISHIPTVIPELTLVENIVHVLRLSGGDTDRAMDTLRVVGLENAAHRRGSDSSHGMLRRTEIARLLLTRPRLLLLDEAFSGLDADASSLVAALVERTTSSGGAALMVSHDRRQLAGLTERVFTISGGRVEPTP
jgi:heme exporter protein A